STLIVPIQFISIVADIDGGAVRLLVDGPPGEGAYRAVSLGGTLDDTSLWIRNGGELECTGYLFMHGQAVSGVVGPGSVLRQRTGLINTLPTGPVPIPPTPYGLLSLQYSVPGVGPLLFHVANGGSIECSTLAPTTGVFVDGAS